VLSPAARTKMERSRTRAERASTSREPVYGVSTGFGALAGTRVAPLRQPELQLALIRSHAAGVGPPVDEEVVRAAMLLRARTLAMGLSGVRPLLVEAMIAMLNEGVTPVVPRYGSVGGSGAGHRSRVPGAPPGSAPSSRSDRERGQPCCAHARLADRGVAPPFAACGPGLLLGEVQPPGGGGRAGHARFRAPRRRGRAGLRDRQPDSARGRRGGVDGQLPRRAVGFRRRLPGDSGG